MSHKKKASLYSFIITLLYIGAGTLQLISILSNSLDSVFPFGQLLDKFLLPSYAIGLTMAFVAGTGFVMIGQMIAFGICFRILYGLFFLIFKVKNS